MKRRFYLFKNTEGGAAVEFALVVPAMLLVMTGIMEAGQGYMIRKDLQYALDEAARYVMINPTADSEDIEAHVASRVSSISADDIVVNVEDVVVNDNAYKNIHLAYSFDTISGDVLAQEEISITVETTVPAIP